MDRYTIPLHALPAGLKVKLDARESLNSRDRSKILRVIINDIGINLARDSGFMQIVAGTIIETWPHLRASESNLMETKVWFEQLKNMQKNMSKWNV